MTKAAIAAAAPALGYSILANLGDEKQLTVQCFVDSEEPLADIHSKLDKAMAVVDRLKAKNRRVDLLAEVDKMESTLRNLEEDLRKLEENFEANQDAIDLRILEHGAKITDITNLAVQGGRAKPVGADARQIEVLKAEREKLAEEKAHAEADRNQARHNTAINIGRYREEIAKAKDQIAECDALISGG